MKCDQGRKSTLPPPKEYNDQNKKRKYINNLNYRVAAGFLAFMMITTLVLELLDKNDTTDYRISWFFRITMLIFLGRFIYDTLGITVNIKVRQILGSRRKHISSAPGTKLLSVVEFLFSPVTVEETFKPIVAEWQHEYFNALNQKRAWKAHWISIRNYWYFVKAAGWSKIFSLFKGALLHKKLRRQ